MEAANLYVLGEKSMGNLLALPETAVYLDPTRFSSSFLMLGREDWRKGRKGKKKMDWKKPLV